MKIGQSFRYARPYDSTYPEIDGLPNFFNSTKSEGESLVLLDSGINPSAQVNFDGEARCPVILLRSSPHKIGSEDTPWQDYYDPDNGHIRYFGDNKLTKPPRSPETPKGNKALLKQFDLYRSTNPDARALAAPLLCFRAVPFNGKSKGAVQFEGFGLIGKVEKVSQYDGKSGEAFTNYVYDIVVFDMSAEYEEFDWRWITARRDKAKSIEECLSLAPESWKTWVREGDAALERCRRRVAKLMTTKTQDQQPETKREKEALEAVYRYYDGRKARFEALASIVAARVIRGDGADYREGWITAASSDGGADFIGRLDVGSGFSKAKIIVLGQAKCEKLTSPTGGNHIARTVARLRRGWIGVYVTTSYFSEAVQREVIEDRYPIILINGQRLAHEVLTAMNEQGVKSINEYLDQVDAQYDSMLALRGPEEILFD